MSTTVGQLFVELKNDSKRYKRDLVKTTTDAGKEGGKAASKSLAKSLGDGLRQHSKLIAASAGAALGTFVAGGAQAFASFEKGMNEVFTLMPGITGPAMDEMSAQVKDFSNEFGVLPDEVIPALYNSLSAGVPPDNVFEFLETANAAAKAGAATTDEAVALLSQSVNAWGLEMEDATRVSDAMFTTVRLGVTNFPLLSQHMNKVSASASVLGVSVEEVGAAAAALTKQGQPTEIAMTNLAATMTLLQKGTPELTRVLEHMGYESGQAALDALGLQGTLEMLRTGADDLDIAIPKMTGRIQAANAIFGLTGEKAAVANDILGDFEETTGATAKAFKQMDQGVQASANRIAARMQTLMIDLGGAIAPVAPMLVAFGPTIGRALGGAFGAGFGLLVEAIPRLMAPVLAKMSALIAGSQLTGSLGAAITSGLTRQGFMSRLPGIGGKWGKVLGIGLAAAMVPIILDKMGELQDLWAENDASAATLSETRRDIAENDTQTIAEMRENIAGLKAARQDILEGKRGFLQDFAFSLNLGGTQEEMDASIEALEREIEQRLEMRRHQNATATLPVRIDPNPYGDDAFARGDLMSTLPEVTGDDVGGPDGTNLFGAIGDMMEQAADQIADLGPMVAKEVKVANRKAAHESSLMGPSIREGIKSGKDAVDQAMADLRWSMTHPMQNVKYIAKLEGKLTGDNLRKGLKSSNPDIRAEALRTKSVLIDEWEKATGETWDWGAKVSTNLAGGVKSRRKKVRQAAKANRLAVNTQHEAAAADATEDGAATTMNFAAGMQSFIGNVVSAAQAVAQAVADNTEPGSPTKEGPLSETGGTEGWGERLAEQFAAGLASSKFDPVAALGLSSFDAVGAATRGATAPTAARAGAGAGSTNINMKVEGLPMRARTPLEVAQQMRRAARLGVTAPTRRAAFVEAPSA